MNCVHLILKAPALSISILRETRACNIDVIRRSAKDIRDPNPLQTTMAHLSRKYPISLNTANARKHHVPPDFLSNALDNHRRERTLARMDSIDWWVTQAPLPSIEHQNLKDVLYSFPEKRGSGLHGHKLEGYSRQIRLGINEQGSGQHKRPRCQDPKASTGVHDTASIVT